jgi:hypothetical protein
LISGENVGWLRLQLHHDEAMTMALQKMIEATNQLKDSSLLNQR